MVENRFEFGRNWKKFIDKSFSQERVDISKKHILDFLELEHLKGKTFIDAGCGSGLHSLAAYQAGAESILSFDYDAQSVEATRYVREHKVGDPRNWTVEQGSVLNFDYINRIGKADIVYSWGVLHHTGDLWGAIRNAAKMIGDEGLFYIALYSANVQKDPPPEFWLDIKKKYVSSSRFQQRRMVAWYVWNFALHRKLRNLRYLIRTIREYKKQRGMSYFTDVRDWLGGWPMEFSWDEDVLAFCRDQLGLNLVKISQGEANTEYLFKKQAATEFRKAVIG